MRTPTATARPLFIFAATALAAAACSSGSGSGATGPVGGAVTGAADTHCTDPGTGAAIKSPIGACVDPCPVDTGGTSGTTGDTGNNGGGGAGDSGGGSDFGATMYNSEGDDDDCKYHVMWTSTPVRRNADVTFNVTVGRRLDGMPATGADVTPEVFLTISHPTPTSQIPSHETPAGSGTYEVGPLRFDAAGRWTVRFHFYEHCCDQFDDSPHGHAAFYVDVP